MNAEKKMLQTKKWSLQIKKWPLQTKKWSLQIKKWTLQIKKWTLQTKKWSLRIKKVIVANKKVKAANNWFLSWNYVISVDSDAFQANFLLPMMQRGHAPFFFCKKCINTVFPGIWFFSRHIWILETLESLIFAFNFTALCLWTRSTWLHAWNMRYAKHAWNMRFPLISSPDVIFYFLLRKSKTVLID